MSMDHVDRNLVVFTLAAALAGTFALQGNWRTLLFCLHFIFIFILLFVQSCNELGELPFPCPPIFYFYFSIIAERLGWAKMKFASYSLRWAHTVIDREIFVPFFFFFFARPCNLLVKGFDG